MSSDKMKEELVEAVEPTSLPMALDQNEQVREKVEQCAVDLSSVNAVLKQQSGEGVLLQEVERAISKNEEVEVKVQECADDLDTVNSALSQEIDERKNLDEELSKSNAALSESQAQEKRSLHLALHDAVTGLPNLPLFHDRLRHALTQAQRHKWRLAVMFIDLDGFKNINDTYGHDVGDQVLQMVAQRLGALVRGEDTVSRRGGDEFLLLMLDAKDETNTSNLAAKLIDNIADACEVGGVKLMVRASIGIAIYPEDGKSAKQLLKNADTAMYAAKRQKTGFLLYSQVAIP